MIANRICRKMMNRISPFLINWRSGKDVGQVTDRDEPATAVHSRLGGSVDPTHPPCATPTAEQTQILNRIQELESAGNHLEASALCEGAISGDGAPEIHLALARNRFALAAGGNDSSSLPALKAALAGIEKRCPNQPDVAYAISICRWVADRLVLPPPPQPAYAHPELLQQIQELETAGKHTEAVALCEGAISRDQGPEIHLALSRNRFALAAGGNDASSLPALKAALAGIEKRCPNQPDVAYAIDICRWVADRLVLPPPPQPAYAHPELLQQIQELETAGKHTEAVALCEGAISGDDAPEIHLALSRNRFALAAGGNDPLSLPALMAALAGIEKRCLNQPDVAYAIDICRWVAGRLVLPPPPRSTCTHPALHQQIKDLETAGKHTEAVALGEKAIIADASADIHLVLAWNRLLLASQGNELHAWPALLAALDALEKQSLDPPGTSVAINICRWVLDFFADSHRMDIRGASTRLTRNFSGKSDTAEAGPQPDGVPAEGTNLDELMALFRAGENVRVGNALLSSAPSTIRYKRDEQWVAREVRYLLANVLSPVSGETIAETLSGEEYPMPGDYEAQVYDRYLYTAAQIQQQRIRARSRGVPGILISSLPKSASEFLCYTLANSLQSPVVRVTIGDPFLGTAYRKWVADLMEGGCVTHDHFAASDTNLAALRDGGARGVWVLVRDPRAVFWSLQNMEHEYDGIPAASRISLETTPALVKRLADWIDSWVRARAGGFPVTFIPFRDLTAHPADVMGTILRAEGAERFIPQLQAQLQQREQNRRVSNNFRTGDDEAWRKGIPKEWHHAIWDVIPETVRRLLNLQP